MISFRRLFFDPKFLLLLLWLQLWWGLIPSWRDGEYYAYGWLVPFSALGFAFRRWQMSGESGDVGGSEGGRSLGWQWGLLLLVAVLLILPLRLIAEADPGWRVPLLLHALMVFALTHLLLWRSFSKKASLGLLPVTVFALTAVPLPWQIEQRLVRSLTGTVIELTREAFLLLGRPVEAIGERLAMDGQVVEVTEGCSGIRSLQSLGMAALFFGELLLLGWGRRLVLVGVAAFCAVFVNTARAWWLAEIHFLKGPAAAEAAHDGIGHMAFAVSAGILFASACLIRRRHVGRHQIVVKRIQNMPSTPAP
jgi:exosortase